MMGNRGKSNISGHKTRWGVCFCEVSKKTHWWKKEFQRRVRHIAKVRLRKEEE